MNRLVPVRIAAQLSVLRPERRRLDHRLLGGRLALSGEARHAQHLAARAGQAGVEALGEFIDAACRLGLFQIGRKGEEDRLSRHAAVLSSRKAAMVFGSALAMVGS